MSSAWSQLAVSEPLIRALLQRSFDQPTPIQRLAIPAALRDRQDVLGAAETGSGKTLAFGIPLIEFVLQRKGSASGPLALILSPTRELAIQTHKHLVDIGKHVDVSFMCLVGGLALPKQQRLLQQRRPDVLIATPGRLWDVMEETVQDHVSPESIRRIQFLVVDEADRMTQKGHFEELIRIMHILKQEPTSVVDSPDDGENTAEDEIPHYESSEEDSEVEDLDKEVDTMKRTESLLRTTESSQRTTRQTLVFSATLTSITGRLRGFKDLNSKIKFLMSSLNMRTEKAKVIDLTTDGIGKPDKEFLQENCITCENSDKDLFLYYFLTEYPGKSIVFCNSKDCLRRLVSVFKILQMNPIAFHADMDQKRRLVALERFTASGDSGLMVASDVASRGLDIFDIRNVIHYQVPRNTEIYVHRSGRTARALRSGMSLLLVEPKEAVNYRSLCRSLNGGEHFDLLPIKDEKLRVLKKHVELAKQIDVIEHRSRKHSANVGWFRKMAREADIDLEDRDDLFSGDDDEEAHKDVHRLHSLKAALSQRLLSRDRQVARILSSGLSTDQVEQSRAGCGSNTQSSPATLPIKSRKRKKAALKKSRKKNKHLVQ